MRATIRSCRGVPKRPSRNRPLGVDHLAHLQRQTVRIGLVIAPLYLDQAEGYGARHLGRCRRSDHPRYEAIALTLALVVGTFSLLQVGTVGLASASSGSIGATPNPAPDVVSVSVQCQWSSAVIIMNQPGGGGFCYVDGVVFYQNAVSTGGGSHTFAPGALADGSHTLRVSWSTGWSPVTHHYSYSSTTNTLTINHCGSATIKFHVYETFEYPWSGSVATITFNGGSYSDGGAATIATGCGMSYPISAQDSTTWTFFEWVTSTDGHFADPSSKSTTFSAGASGGSVDLVVWNFAIAGGYIAYSGSLTEATARFALPTTVSYVATLASIANPVALPVGVGIGGVNARGLWQAGVMVLVPQPGTSVFVCDTDGSQQCWNVTTVWMCPFTFDTDVVQRLAHYHFYCDQVPNISLGDTISVDTWYTAQAGTMSFLIQDVTTGYGYGSSVTYTPDLTTAEWGVLEAACIGGGIGGYVPDCYGEAAFN